MLLTVQKWWKVSFYFSLSCRQVVSTTSIYIELNYKPNIYIYIHNLFFVVFSIEVAISRVITVASTTSLNKSFRQRTTTMHSGRVSNSTPFFRPLFARWRNFCPSGDNYVWIIIPWARPVHLTLQYGRVPGNSVTNYIYYNCHSFIPTVCKNTSSIAC